LDPAHQRWVSFLAPSCACGSKALVATGHNASSEKKQRGDYLAALLVLDRFATAHFCAADAERREA
jgi:hypothetical protein